MCNSLSLAKALSFAIERKAEVINLSLSGPPDRLLDRLLDAALERGISIVGAIDPRAAGANDLIKQGATLVTEAADVINAVQPIMARPLALEEPEDDYSEADPAADERARIVALLGPSPILLDDLIRMAGSSPAIVRTVLLELELAGRLERHGGGMVSLI